MKKIRLAVVGINYPDYVVGVGMIRQLAPEEYSDTELFITCDRMNIYDPEAKMVSYFGFDLGHISWFDLFKLGHLDDEPVNARLLEVRPHAFIIEAEVPDVVKPLQYGKCPIVLDTAFLLEASKQEQHFCTALSP